MAGVDEGIYAATRSRGGLLGIWDLGFFFFLIFVVWDKDSGFRAD